MSWTKKQINLLNEILKKLKNISYKNMQLNSNLQSANSDKVLVDCNIKKDKFSWLDF